MLFLFPTMHVLVADDTTHSAQIEQGQLEHSKADSDATPVGTGQGQPRRGGFQIHDQQAGRHARVARPTALSAVLKAVMTKHAYLWNSPPGTQF